MTSKDTTRKLTRKRAAVQGQMALRTGGHGPMPKPLVRYHPDRRGEFADAMDATEGHARIVVRPFANLDRRVRR